MSYLLFQTRCVCDKKGYKYNETLKACVNVDECSMNNSLCEAMCENLQMDVAGATHRCSCPDPGLKLSPDGITCVGKCGMDRTEDIYTVESLY